MIFISYAREDHGYACKLFLALKAVGLDPWMDKPPPPHEIEGIQIGQRWRAALHAKLREADHIVLLLSPRSVRKRGFVQVEFRTALSLMNEIPAEQVFVLPVLSEKCEVPALRVGEIELLDLHWEEVKESQIPSFASRLATSIGVPAL